MTTRRAAIQRRAVPPLFLAAACLVWLATLPEARTFDLYALLDGGSSLSIPALSRTFGNPVVSYGYSYGAFSNWLTLMWAPTWRGMTLKGLPAMAAFYWILGRIGLELELSWFGIAFLLGMSPLLLSPPFLGVQPAMEAIALLLAMLAQIRGQYGWALTACVAAALFKPSMAYFYGALLLFLLCRQDGWSPRRIIRDLRLPGAAAGLALLAASLRYSLRSALLMEDPLKTAAHYKAMGFGLFGSDTRQFWSPAGKHFAYYAGTPAGAWLAATAAIFAAAVLYRGRGRAIVAICGTLQVCALLVFGPPSAWAQYSYFMVIGIAAAAGAAGAKRGPRLAAAGLVALTLAGGITYLRYFRQLLTYRPRASMNGLYAPEREVREWDRIAALGTDADVLLLTPMGSLTGITAQVHSPDRWMLLPGIGTPAEMRRVEAQIAAAGYVVVPADYDPGRPGWQTVAGMMKNLKVVDTGAFFTVLTHERRARP